MLAAGDSFGRYAIEAVLGEGGMGRVYRATDTLLARRVALKVLHADADTKRRILREARAAAALSHPNAVAVHDVGEIDGVPFLAMEYLEGKPLRAYVGDASVPFATRVRWLADVARALAEAHRRGLVHRDIKPENVIVTAAGAVKVLDFGIARTTTPSAGAPVTTTGAIVGTPRYMAPEQMLGEAVDGRADQFAWGVVAFELLTGTFPWGDATDGIAIVARVMGGSRVRLVGRSGVPDEIARAVDRVLEREPAKRFASMDDLVASMDRFATSDTVESRRVVAPPAHRSRRLGVAAAAVIAAAGIALAVIFGVQRTPRGAAAAPSQSGSAAASSASIALAITDAPPPETTSREAAALYASALQKIRDGAPRPATDDLFRAVKLDPSFAAAHLRLLCYADYRHLEQAQSRVAQIAAFRAKLKERDLALMTLCEVGFPNVPKPEEVPRILARARATAERFGGDAEIVVNAGVQHFVLGDLDGARRLLERAAELDADSGYAQDLLAVLPLFLDDANGALGPLDACLAKWPRASACYEARCWVDSILGRCEAMEAHAQAFQTIDPAGGAAANWVARGLAQRATPPESVRRALDRDRELQPDPKGWGRWNDAFYLIWLGNFAAAEAALLAIYEKEASTFADDGAAMAMRMLLEVALEAGDVARAKDHAKRYLDGLPARLGNAAGVARPFALAILRREHAISDARYRALHEELVRDAVPQPLYAMITGKNALFYDLYASLAYTKDEALEAIDALPRYSPLPKFVAYTVYNGPRDRYPDRAMGTMYSLAGRYEDAIAPLRRGVATCDLLHAVVEHMRGRVALGAALEATSDKAGACAEYRYVLERWPSPKPRSVSVDAARARSTALGCGGSL